MTSMRIVEPRTNILPLTGAFARFLTVIRVEEPPEDAIDIDSSLKETSTIASLSQFGSTVKIWVCSTA